MAEGRLSSLHVGETQEEGGALSRVQQVDGLGVEVDDEEIDGEIFETVGTLADFIAEKLDE